MSRVERHAAEEAAYINRKESDGGSGRRRSKGKMTPFGRFLDIVGTLILVVTILTCLGLAAPRLAKIQTYVVLSGSMEPAIPVGSLVYAKAAEPETLEPGDVIVFYSTDASSATGGKGAGGAIPITHRVVENHKDESEVITKGDANDNNDLFPTPYNNIVGKVITHVPGLGQIAGLFATTMGKIAVALIILAGYLLTEAGSAINKKR